MFFRCFLLFTPIRFCYLYQAVSSFRSYNGLDQIYPDLLPAASYMLPSAGGVSQLGETDEEIDRRP